MLLHTDLPSLFVVAAGIAVLSGLLCFVLKLFSSNRYGDGGHYANANLAPPLLFSTDNQWINGKLKFELNYLTENSFKGIPLTVHGRPSSRSSSQRSTANLAHYKSKGVLVPASRAGAARAAAILLIPCHLQNARTPDAVPSSHDDDLESPKGNSWLLSWCRGTNSVRVDHNNAFLVQVHEFSDPPLTLPLAWQLGFT